MKKRTKAIAFLLVALLLVLAGCGGGGMSVPEDGMAVDDTPEQDAASPGSESNGEPVPGAKSFKIASNSGTLSLAMAELFCDEVERLSGGMLTTERYLTGQMGTNDEDLCTGLSEGNFDMLLTSDMISSWVMPEWLGYANVAFCFRDAEHVQKYWVMLDEEYGLNEKATAEYNARVMITEHVAVRTPRYITANKAIQSPEDIKGVKFRTPSVEGVVASWEACGASVTPIPLGELFSALQTGTAEAQENPTEQLQQLGISAVQSHLMLSAHQYGAHLFHSNETWYQSLSVEEQGWINEALETAYEFYNTTSMQENEEVIAQLEEEGMTVIPAEEMDIQAFKDAIIQPVLTRFEGTWYEGGWDIIQAL